MIRWFAKNDVAANLLMVAILLLGIWTAMTRVPLQVSPSYEYQSVIVTMSYRGGTAKDVERSIIVPIEGALSDLSGIKRLWTRSSRDSAFCWITLDEAADPREMLEEIKARIDRIPSFPSETEKPIVRLPNSDRYRDIVGVAITGNMTEEELVTAAERVRDDLTGMEGISQAKVTGTRRNEIAINVDQEKLRSLGVTFQDISEAIRRFSVDLPAGTIRSESGTLTVRALGQAESAEEYAAIPIRAADGTSVTVGEVAEVIDGYEGAESIVRFNGDSAFMVRVMRHDMESAIDIAEKVKDYAARAGERFPDGINLYVWDDESIAIRSRLGTLAYSLLQGSVLVFIVLALFLRPAVAFWVVIGIPVSFAGGILMMPFFGVSANLMSVFGFIIVVGLVVDDAIVTGENIYANLRTGGDPLEAVITGTKEVATPVTFGVITTIVAFLPLMFYDGHWGNYAKQIPPVVAPVLLFSLVESKLILPSHLKHIRTGLPRKNWFSRLQGGIARGLERFVEKVYTPTLDFALRNRYGVCSAFLAMALLMTGYFRGGHMDFITIPSVERNVVVAKIDLPRGTRVPQTEVYVRRIAEAANQLRDHYQDGDTGRSIVSNIYEISGDRGRGQDVDEEDGMVMVELLVPSERSVPGPTSTEFAKHWKELVGEIPEARRFSIRGEKSGHSRSAQIRVTEPMEIEIRGPGSEQKVELSERVIELLKSYERISSAYSDVGRSSDEIEIVLKPRAAELGLSQATLARQVRQAFFGDEAQRIQRGTDDIRVMVRLDEKERESLHTLDTLKIQTPSGTSVAMDSVADIRMVKVPRSIERIDAAEVIEIIAQPEDPSTDIVGISEAIGPEIQAILNEGDNLSYRFTGYIAESEESNRRTMFASLGLLFALFALLAIPFKSVIQPIFVLLAVPFGVIGALLGHMIMGITPSYLSIFGMLALAGVVVNDSLVLVDFVNRKRDEGIPIDEAIRGAGARRFRPILLTSLTTFAGLLPLMFDKSIEGQFLVPMAVSLGYGIVFATAITLYLIPCAYKITEDLRGGASKARHWYARPFSNAS